MSEETVIDPPETFVATAVPLLREYQGKLEGIRNRMRELKEVASGGADGKDMRAVTAEKNFVLELLRRLQPACRNLAQQVSGMIDQGKLTPLERVELQLRLAEFESALAEVPKLVAVYRPA